MVTDCEVELHDARLRGDTDTAIVAGELLVTRMTIKFAAGLHVRLSTALPEPAAWVKDTASGFVAQVTFGVVGVALFKITAEYATARDVASIAPTMTMDMYFAILDSKRKNEIRKARFKECGICFL